MSKRKAYRPKHVNPQSWLIAMKGACKLTLTEQLTRSAKVRASVEELCASRGQLSTWGDIFDTINLIEAMEHVGVIKDAREFVEAHQQNLVEVMDRHRATGSNVLRPVECALLRDLAATWAEVLAEVTCSQYFQAEERVRRKVAAVLRGKPAPGVRVLVAA